MPIIRLTQANLEHVKRALRQKLPKVKSSHLTEAIAASADFRTHAAMLVALDRGAPGSEPIANVNEHRLNDRLLQLSGALHGDAVSAALSEVRHNLPEPCWQSVRNGDCSHRRKWYYECERLKMPFLTVNNARKYATLEWDCITTESGCDEAVRGDRGAGLVRELYADFRQHCVAEAGRPYFDGSAFYGTIERLLPETAFMLADKYFTRLYTLTRSKPLPSAA